jgi:hypothetical protein
MENGSLPAEEARRLEAAARGLDPDLDASRVLETIARHTGWTGGNPAAERLSRLMQGNPKLQEVFQNCPTVHWNLLCIVTDGISVEKALVNCIIHMHRDMQAYESQCADVINGLFPKR